MLPGINYIVLPSVLNARSKRPPMLRSPIPHAQHGNPPHFNKLIILYWNVVRSHLSPGGRLQVYRQNARESNCQAGGAAFRPSTSVNWKHRVRTTIYLYERSVVKNGGQTTSNSSKYSQLLIILLFLRANASF